MPQLTLTLSREDVEAAISAHVKSNVKNCTVKDLTPRQGHSWDVLIDSKSNPFDVANQAMAEKDSE